MTIEMGRLVLITPDVAEEWLRSNQGNRNVRERWIAQIASAMQEGRWVVNGDTIKFASDGRLLDGQHRLLACVRAQIPFLAYVIKGLDSTVFDTIDQNKSRSTADILRSRGEIYCMDLGRLLTLVWRYQKDCLGKSLMPSNQERNLLLELNPELRDSLRKVRELCIKPIMPDSLSAFILWAGSKIDEQATALFLAGVATGEDLEAGHPALVLRNTAISSRSRYVKSWHDLLCAYAFKALGAFFLGRKIVQLRMGSNEKFPSLKAENFSTYLKTKAEMDDLQRSIEKGPPTQEMQILLGKKQQLMRMLVKMQEAS
jgi:hypothetical protein